MVDGKKKSRKSLELQYCDLLNKVNERRSRRGKKPFKFNVSEIILANGAVATWKPKISKMTGKFIPKWTIIKGTDSAYLDKIRKIKRKSKTKKN
jgi:hypothetical protein